ncbi:anti-sigma factor domain-containing protein [Candidatus Pristimantibacillus sp. PTI5]|uniref:anti-sigma factor domain-containing protein n=1 Tax=Candidatus Pristimantibacillus sp. PTI5 TaxID=3400422 RepID=UPI003B01B7D7
MNNQHNISCEDVEMYLLGGLDEEDKLAFEAHLLGCKECQLRLEELSEVLGIMPLTVQPVQPPSGMKARILAAVAEADRASAEESKTGAEALTQVQTVPLKPVVEIVSAQKTDKNKAKSWTTPTLAAAAAALLIISAALYQQVNQLNGESNKLAVQVQELQRQLEAAEQPPTGIQVNSVVALTPAIPDIVAQGLATIVIDTKGMHLIVQAENLPKLTNDEAFQVWLLKEGKPVNAGTFLTNDGTGALYYTFAPDQYDQIAITHEPDAKGLQPRGEIVLAGKLVSG